MEKAAGVDVVAGEGDAPGPRPRPGKGWGTLTVRPGCFLPGPLGRVPGERGARDAARARACSETAVTRAVWAWLSARVAVSSARRVSRGAEAARTAAALWKGVPGDRVEVVFGEEAAEDTDGRGKVRAGVRVGAVGGGGSHA